LYRSDNQRLYVTYGGGGAAGGVKSFDGRSYKLLKDVKLLPDTDPMAYDPETKYMYVNNGGGDAHQIYSMTSLVDTNSMEKLKDIKVPGETLEAIALESSGPKLYLNNRANNQVDVIDRKGGKILASWPVTMGKENVPLALDGRIIVYSWPAAVEISLSSTQKQAKSSKCSRLLNLWMIWSLIRKVNGSTLPVVRVAAKSTFSRRKIQTTISSSGRFPLGPGGRRRFLCPRLRSTLYPYRLTKPIRLKCTSTTFSSRYNQES
jgi:hypothetical protein